MRGRKPHWLEWVLLVVAIVGSLIGVGYTVVSVGLVDVGGDETVSLPTVLTAVPPATQVVVSTKTPISTNAPKPAVTRPVLELREVAQPGWIEFSREDTERVFSFVDPDEQKHRLFGFCLGRNCSKHPKEDVNALLIYLRNGDPIPSAKIGFYELIFIEEDQGAAIVRIVRTGDPQWLEPANDGLDVGDYAVVNVYIYSGGSLEIGYNQSPSSHSLVE